MNDDKFHTDDGHTWHVDFDQTTGRHTLTITSPEGEELIHGTITTDQLRALARQLFAAAGRLEKIQTSR